MGTEIYTQVMDVPNSVCIICDQRLFPAVPGERQTDVAWDETRCWPHNDPEKVHTTLRMLFWEAHRLGAPRPHQVARATAVLLWYEYSAPDNAVEAEYIDAAVEFLGDGMGLRLT